MVKFRLLGPLDVVLDGRHVRVPPGKRRVLLAALLLRPGQVVGTDHLLDLLGGTRNGLQTTVGRLREDLGKPELVQTRPGGYLIDVTPNDVDVSLFHTVKDPEEALKLWRGRPLEDIGSEALERDHVPALTEQYLTVLESRIEQDLARNKHEQLVPELRALTQKHPTRERMWAQLVIALHRCDRQTEALQAYDDIRHRLADELGLDPGKDLQKAHQQVLTADNRPRARNDLPGDIADFAGREHDLDEILAAVPSGCVAITAIDGMAGIGKTTLAVRAAHRLKDKFPDAQLFVDLHSYTAGVEPRSPADALLTLLTALGLSTQDIPDDLDARAARWRAEMAHRKAVVVLDNAGSAAQVRPLLPGTGMVLVTSRRRLVDLDAAHTISLDVLPEPDALALLASIAGQHRLDHDPVAAQEIVKLCGHLPLAVRIVGARWRSRPAWTAQEVKRRLADQRLDELTAGERSVAGAFALSYQQLTPDQQRMFRVLGLHTGPDWDRHLAAAMLGVTSGQAERLLDELLDVHLVQQQENGRYRFHDLLADHAKAMVVPEEAEEARVRLLDHYLHAVESAQLVLAPGAPRIRSAVRYEPVDPPRLGNPTEVMAWLDAERENLVAAVYLAAYQGHYEHAWQLPHQLTNYLSMRGFGRARLQLLKIARAATQQLGDLRARAEVLKGLGAAMMRDDTAKAVEQLEEALSLMRQVGNLRGEASALGLLGIIARDRFELDKAMTYFQRGVVLMRQVGAPTGEANALHNIGIIHAEWLEHDEALAHMEEARVLLQSNGELAAAAGALNDIGYVRFQMYDDEAFLECSDNSLVMYRKSGDWRGEFINRADYAFLLHAIGLVDRVREVVQEGTALARRSMNLATDGEVLTRMTEIGDVTGEFTMSFLLTFAAELDGRFAEAVGFAERGLRVYRAAGRRWGEHLGLVTLSRLHLKLGDTATAVRYAEEAVRCAERVNQPRGIAIARDALATATAPAAPAP